MSLYVLDTDSLTLLQQGHAALVQRVAARPPQEMAITVITVEEQLTGWYGRLRRATRPDELARVYARLIATVQFVARWPILPFPEPAILRFEQLRALRLNVSTKDLRIAAITLENGGTVVTRNLRDFQRIPQLPVEDWSV
jgi:tRNA(fMet)-specific endonuclease VapC